MKLCHLTSAHPRYDTRIFYKECYSLLSYGAMYLIVADGKGNECKDKIEIIDVGKPVNRFARMLLTTRAVYQAALKIDANCYHIHDPELIPIGLKLKNKGKKVVFDAHEDVPKQILSKFYLPSWLRLLVSKVFAYYESYSCKQFTAIVAATPTIRDKFLNINKNVIDVNNFPLLSEFQCITDWSNKDNIVCYVGGLSVVRGIEELIQAMSLTKNCKLELAGNFNEKKVEEKVKMMPGFQVAKWHGHLNRQGVSQVISRARAGIVILKPIANYLEALPVKMFEYMATGIPVIASNFPLWQQIISQYECGLCVNPLEPKEIANAIQFFIDHPDEAKRMGNNGRKAVDSIFNWFIEEKKLIALYEKIIE